MAEVNLAELVPSGHQRVVAAEVDWDGKATLFVRAPEGTLETVRVPFEPWLLVTERVLGEELDGVAQIVPLEGEGVFRERVCFRNLRAYTDGTRELRKLTGKSATSVGSPYRVVSDFQQQFLSTCPVRLFRGMTFPEVRRLQLDIETLTTPGFDFPNAEREQDQIMMIALRDSTGWERCLSGPELSEKQILEELVAVIQERDPDVIEGHNIFDFDLSFIETRAKRHKVKLRFGRNGSVAKGRSSRFSAGERVANYRRFDIYGRHVIDTLHMTKLYDVIHRDLDSYGLKAVARYFGVAAPERTYVAGGEISRIYHEDPKRLRAYAMDDVRETDAISRLLSQSYFHQAQLVPYSYQNCVTRGNASRIDALLVGEYLRQGQSIPVPEQGRPFAGGLTASMQEGVFRNVWHVDVRSLYPSIIVSGGLCPARDRLGLFNRLLTQLRQFRLSAKDAKRQATDPVEKDHFEALQSTFKILINSFYGYVGFGIGTFNDFGMAEAVTAKGRDILRTMQQYLEGIGATVIEMDTDGIYFVPPKDVSDTGEMQNRIQTILPEGIEVELDAVYDAMFGYKSKNYALLDYEGKVSVTGAALRSRGLEPFQRRYIHDLITMLLKGRAEELPTLYERYRQDIAEHKLPLAEFAKRETLANSPKSYAEKIAAGTTRRSAAYELVLAAEREYKQGDQVAFYVTGEKKNVAVVDAARLLADADPDVRDENVPYYQDKLAKLHRKFASPVETQATLF